jgi:hypothetical protein
MRFDGKSSAITAMERIAAPVVAKPIWNFWLLTTSMATEMFTDV